MWVSSADEVVAEQGFSSAIELEDPGSWSPALTCRRLGSTQELKTLKPKITSIKYFSVCFLKIDRHGS